MDGEGLAPSPIARLLLDLSERGAEGSIAVGDRRVVLQGGAAVDVHPGPDDISFEAFLAQVELVDSVVLEAACDETKSTGASLDEVLQRLTDISAEALADARRAMWLDRLVRGIAVDEDAGAAPAPFLPEAGHGDGSLVVPLVPLILDALARRAAHGDAGLVGGRPSDVFRWEDGPHRAASEAWATIQSNGDAPSTIGALLRRHPATASSIAALVRAGVARMEDPDAPAPPAPTAHPSLAPPSERPPSVLPPPPDDPVEAELSKTVATPPPLTRSPLDPGAAIAPAAASRGAPRLAPATHTLNDPLAPIERRIQGLEQSGASGHERAEAFRDLARVWQSAFASLSEACRAYREAAAADPSDVVALEQSAVLCAAVGDLDLSVAYDQALLNTGNEAYRRSTLMRLARTALRAGDPATCVEALMKAGRGGDFAEPLELAAEVLRLSGDTERALREAQRAARFLVGDHPGRARALLAWAHSTRRNNPLLVSEYATALSADGYQTAAIAVLADAAETASSEKLARSLRREGAERALRAGQGDVAAALLTRLHHDDPRDASAYEPLLRALEASGTFLSVAIAAESIARDCPPDERARWLIRAAISHREAGADIDHMATLLSDALRAEPSGGEALVLLDEIAHGAGDRELPLDAIERALRFVEGDARLGLLAELGMRANESDDGSARALWAFSELSEASRDGGLDAVSLSHLADRARVEGDAVRAAEEDLRSATPEDRPAASRRLAALLRTQPNDRKRAMALYEDAIAADPSDSTAATAYERLAWTAADDDDRFAHATRRLTAITGTTEKLRLLRRIMRLTFRDGHHEASADTGRILLSIAPDDPEALLRVGHSAVAGGDLEIIRRALELRLQAARGARERAHFAAELAVVEETTGDVDAAVKAARLALSLAPSSARAAAILVRHLGAMSKEEGVEALLAARCCFGDSAPLLAQLAETATKAGMRAARDEAIEAWCGVSPLDPVPAMQRLLWATPTEDVERLRPAIVHALGAHGVDEQAIIRALSRLVAVAGPDAAAPLALRAVDRLGHRSSRLIRYARSVANGATSPEPQVAAIERSIALSRSKQGALPHLEALSFLYRRLDRLAAEARTLLRVLSVDSHHEDALVRLTEIYAGAGETDRLLAVLALRLESAPDLEDRGERLLDLAVTSLERAADVSRAVGFVERFVEEGDDDPGIARRVACAIRGVADAATTVSVLRGAASRLPPSSLTAASLFEQAILLAEAHGTHRRLGLEVASEGLAHCPRSAPILVSYERLALALGETDAARRTYGELANRAMGRHGRRALFYREARFIERAGDLPGALDAYVRAFDLSPGAGVVYKAATRLSQQLGDYRALARTTETLALSLRHPDARLEMLIRAAQIYEGSLDDPSKAFDVLFGALEELGKRELLEDLRRLASILEDQGGDAGRAARGRLVALFQHRAEQAWDDEDRAKQLLDVAEMLWTDVGAYEEARTTMENALTLMDGADMDDDARARSFARVAEWLADAAPNEAFEKMQRALDLAPDDEVVQRVSIELRANLGSASSPAEPLPESPAAADSLRPPAPGHQTDSVRPVSSAPTADLPEAGIRAPAPGPTEDVLGPSQIASDEPTDDSERPMTAIPKAPATADLARGIRQTNPGTGPVAGRPDDSEGRPSAVTPGENSEHNGGPRVGPGNTRASERGATKPPPPFAAGDFLDAPATRDYQEVASGVEPPERGIDLAAPEDAPPQVDSRRMDFRPSVVDEAEMQLRSAMARDDDLDAAARLGRTLADNPMRHREAVDVLLWLMRRDPSRTAELRLLASLAAGLNATGVAQTATEIVSLFDPKLDVSGQGALMNVSAYVEEPDVAVRSAALREAGVLLALLWEGAAPLFRQSAQDAGTSGLTPLSPLSPSRLARTYADALRVLSPGEVSLYVKPTPGHDVQVVATHPPAVIAEAGGEAESQQLRFRIGRALEFARPGHILLHVLPPEEGALLLDAVSAAFARPEASPSVARDAMSLAASLWDTIPTRLQGAIREHLQNSGPMAPFEEVRGWARQAGARAGLLLVGSVRTAVETLVADAIDVDANALDDEESFSAAVQTSAPLRAILSFALSDTFLAARARALGAER